MIPRAMKAVAWLAGLGPNARVQTSPLELSIGLSGTTGEPQRHIDGPLRQLVAIHHGMTTKVTMVQKERHRTPVQSFVRVRKES